MRRLAVIATGLALAGLTTCESPARRPADPQPPTPTTSATIPAPVETARVAPGAAKPAPLPQVSSLIGLARKSLAELLGDPDFSRIDDPAALWHYRGASCTLYVFLYADGPSYRVRSVSAQGDARSREAVSAQDCFADLMQARKRAGE